MHHPYPSTLAAEARPTAAMIVVVVAVVVAALPAAACGQTPRTEHTLSLDAARGPPATLDDVRWIAGSWTGRGLGGEVQEMWTAPAGGSMAGVFKLTVGGAVGLYEMMWIVEDGETLALRLKHFNADLSGWEQADEHVDFPLVRMEEGAAYFDGLTYRRVGDGCLVIWVALEEDGVFVEQEIRLARERGDLTTVRGLNPPPCSS